MNVSAIVDPIPIIVDIALQDILTSKEGVKAFFPFLTCPTAYPSIVLV